MEKFQDELKPGGLLIVNSSMINVPVERDDITIVQVPGNAIAIEMGDVRMTNMVLLGAMLAASPVVKLEEAGQALSDHLPERKQHLIAPNIKVLQRGYQIAAELV
jgi:2-oxoglutarate ferredoxin oxidoreductase subunit gamma